jgi:cytochrome c oxidase subunit 2
MRGIVVVEEEPKFQAWLKQQPTFALALAGHGAEQPATSAGAGAALELKGQSLAQSKGCIACHSVDGSPGVGPSWKGLYGRQETLADGSVVAANEEYLKKSIRDPAAQVVKGYPPIMPRIDLSDEETAALLAYIESMKASAAPPPQTQK